MISVLQTGARWAVLGGLAGAIGVVVGVVGAPLHWSFDLLAQFLTETGADELMVASAIWDHGARKRSYEILAEAQLASTQDLVAA